MKRKKVQLYHWRRISQFVFFLLFLFLFIKTDYTGEDTIQYAVNILFRIDPLLAASASLATRTVVSLMLPALITVVLTIILGRIFCGWFCPMGSLLDLCHKFIKPIAAGSSTGYRFFKFYLLIFLLVGAFFGLPIVGYFDPFSILVKAMVLSIYPSFNYLVTSFFTFTYIHAPQWINFVTEPIYAFFKVSILPFRQAYFELSLISLAIFFLLILFEKLERRFFCRNICPLGGLLSIIASFSFLRGHGGAKCGKCKQCKTICRMAAIDEQNRISSMDCNLCMDCVSICPGSKISFHFNRPRPSEVPLSLSRRTVLQTIAGGMAIPMFLPTRTLAKRPDSRIIRPPGALPEDDFTGLCVRCGECMKVCIGNALQPCLFEAGVEAIFTPRLFARVGYCEYNCTLCGQVCPTGAIQTLSLTQKHKIKIGHAYFDKNRCLPYAKGISCIVCEEHCPTPEKAIQFRQAMVKNVKGETVSVKQPYIVDNLCIGCGICEHKCPLPGNAAITLTNAGETRNPANGLPQTVISGGETMYYQ